MKLKTFDNFISEKHDEPWLEPEIEFSRDEDWIEDKKNADRIKFKVVVSDYKSLAILKNLDDHQLYAAYIADEELHKYTLKAVRDRDDEEEYEDVDDEAIMAWASDFKPEDIGDTDQSWESGDLLVKMNLEISKSIRREYQGNKKIIRALDTYDHLLESVSYTTGGVVLIYGNKLDNGKRNLYAAYIKGVNNLERKETNSNMVKLNDDLYRLSYKDGNLIANRIQYDGKSLVQYVGLNGLYVSLNSKTKTPLWYDTVNITNIGKVIKEKGEQIRELDVNL